MQPQLIKKISAGYQITIPTDFRKTHNLDIGSMISIHTDGNKLVIEPFSHKSEALQALQSLFAATPDKFKNLSEQKVSETVAQEIKLSRTAK